MNTSQRTCPRICTHDCNSCVSVLVYARMCLQNVPQQTFKKKKSTQKSTCHKILLQRKGPLSLYTYTRLSQAPSLCITTRIIYILSRDFAVHSMHQTRCHLSWVLDRSKEPLPEPTTCFVWRRCLRSTRATLETCRHVTASLSCDGCAGRFLSCADMATTHHEHTKTAVWYSPHHPDEHTFFFFSCLFSSFFWGLFSFFF